MLQRIINYLRLIYWGPVTESQEILIPESHILYDDWNRLERIPDYMN